MTKPEQLTREDLKSMRPEQIEAARVAGQLADILGQSNVIRLQDLSRMSPSDLAAAEEVGHLDHLLYPPDDAA